MMKSLMQVQFALQRELFTSIRLLTGGVASVAGLSLDESEDCKVCVTESLLLLSSRGYGEARISFEKGEGLSVLLTGVGKAEKGETPSEGEEISIALLEALVDRLDMQRQNGCLAEISFGFGAK